MQHAVPVDTPVGFITGRTAIFLDESHLPVKFGRPLTLVGDVNASMCSRNPTRSDWKYTITFLAVQGVRIADIDFYDLPDHVASFEEVIESEWLADMRRLDTANKVAGDFAHYRFWTSDDVFEVVCARDYKLELLAFTADRELRDGKRPALPA